MSTQNASANAPPETSKVLILDGSLQTHLANANFRATKMMSEFPEETGAGKNPHSWYGSDN